MAPGWGGLPGEVLVIYVERAGLMNPVAPRDRVVVLLRVALAARHPGRLRARRARIRPPVRRCPFLL